MRLFSLRSACDYCAWAVAGVVLFRKPFAGDPNNKSNFCTKINLWRAASHCVLGFNWCPDCLGLSWVKSQFLLVKSAILVLNYNICWLNSSLGRQKHRFSLVESSYSLRIFTGARLSPDLYPCTFGFEMVCICQTVDGVAWRWGGIYSLEHQQEIGMVWSTVDLWPKPSSFLAESPTSCVIPSQFLRMPSGYFMLPVIVSQWKLPSSQYVDSGLRWGTGWTAVMWTTDDRLRFARMDNQSRSVGSSWFICGWKCNDAVKERVPGSKKWS